MNLSPEQQQQQVQMLMQQQVALLAQLNQQHQSSNPAPSYPNAPAQPSAPVYGYPYPVSYSMPPSPPYYPYQQQSYYAVPPSANSQMYYPGYQNTQQNYQHPNYTPPQKGPMQKRFNSRYPMPGQPQERPPKAPQIPASCDTCKKTFDNQKMLEAHLKQHVSCEFCAFSASKRLVMEHQRMNHADKVTANDDKKLKQGDGEDGEGYKPFIIRMETPEEIEKWRAERRKNYPTAENVAKRMNEEEDRKKRLGLKTYRHVKRKQTEALLNTFRKQDGASESKKRKREEDIDESENVKESKKDTVESDDNEAPEEVGTAAKLHDSRSQRLCKYYAKGSCRAGNKCPFKHALPPKKSNDKPSVSENDRRFKHGDLAKMLLENEMQKEKWTVYQAIDFILSKCLKEPGFVPDRESSEEDASDSDSESSSESHGEESSDGSDESDGSEESVSDSETASIAEDENSDNNEEISDAETARSQLTENDNVDGPEEGELYDE